jgi:hypothetical protein
MTANGKKPKLLRNMYRIARRDIFAERYVETRKYIRECVALYFKETTTDQYGQVKVIDVHFLFGKRTEECLEYLRENKKLLEVSTYGWRYGTYQGINPTSGILDKRLRGRCDRALSKNRNYIRVMTTW